MPSLSALVLLTSAGPSAAAKPHLLQKKARAERAAVGDIFRADPLGPAQHQDASGHGLYLELLGAGGLYSINYEYRVPLPLALRVGVSWWEFCVFGCSDVLTVPISLTTFLGDESHHMELGGGVTWVSSGADPEFFLSPQVGYRYMRRQGGFLFRLLFTPLIHAEQDGEVLPFFGLSLGHAWH